MGMLHDVSGPPEQRDLSSLQVACSLCHQVHGVTAEEVAAIFADVNLDRG